MKDRSNIVLDTNVLLQIIPKRSKYRKVWDSFLNGEFCLCVSNEIVAEYHEILSRLSNNAVADSVLGVIINSPYTKFYDPYFRFNIITSDPDDNKFVDCAVVAQAKFIVTNDRHFDEVKLCSFPHIDVISLEEFSEL